MAKFLIATSPLADIIDVSRRVYSPLMLVRLRYVQAKWGVGGSISLFSRFEWGSGERESAETPQTNPELEYEIS